MDAFYLSERFEKLAQNVEDKSSRYHYGCERQGRKGHLAMVKERRLYYK